MPEGEGNAAGTGAETSEMGAEGEQSGQQQSAPTLEELLSENQKLKAVNRKVEGDNKKNLERITSFEESQKSEQQKLEDRATKAEKELAAQQLNSTRLHVALTKKLPAELAVRLQGETEEELSADADALLELMKISPSSVDLGQGARGNGAPPNDMNSLLRQAAGR